MHKISLGSVLLATLAITASLPAKLHGADVVASSIVFQNPQGFLAAWTADGTNVNSASYFIPSQIGDTNWKVVGTGDFNGDGNKDYVFQHTDGSLGVWYMSGNAMVQAAYLEPSQTGDVNWRVAAVADFNQDGRPDLLFQHTDGTVGVWIMNGASQAQASILQPSLTGDGSWRAVGATDFDDDGQTDILFQNRDGTVGIWYMTGLVLKTAVTSPPVDVAWHAVGAKDFNGDRKPDIIFQHDDGTVGMWLIESPTFAAFSNADGTNSGFFLTWPTVLSTTLLNPAQPGEGWKVVVVSD